MILPLPQRLQDLYAVAAKAAEQFGHSAFEGVNSSLILPNISATGVFDPCGLILEIPPRTGYYWCTPKEALTFAATGGDGVHYSYLSSSNLSSSVVPVVMTLPAAEKHNLVVAENIDEFLGLGYHVGWFGLEQIVYQPEAALAYFAQPDPDARECKSARMNFLRSHLSIRPVALSLERIARLTGKYSSFLVVPDEPDET